MPVPEPMSATNRRIEGDHRVEADGFAQQVERFRRIAGAVANVVGHAIGEAYGGLRRRHGKALQHGERIACRV